MQPIYYKVLVIIIFFLFKPMPNFVNQSPQLGPTDFSKPCYPSIQQLFTHLSISIFNTHCIYAMWMLSNVPKCTMILGRNFCYPYFPVWENETSDHLSHQLRYIPTEWILCLKWVLSIATWTLRGNLKYLCLKEWMCDHGRPLYMNIPDKTLHIL